jgi:predicted dehydrogenase
MTTSLALAPGPSSPRLGFLGIGWMGLKRLESIQQFGVAQIAAVCDPARDHVARVRARATGAAVCKSLEHMVDLNLDGIVVCTPEALHAQQCLEALSWGLPIFCQRPLARTAAETSAVVLEAQTQDCLLDVDLCYRHLVAVDAIMDLARSGALGDLYGARLSCRNAGGSRPTWLHDPRLSGGGCAADLATHLVDLAVRVLGSPVVSVDTGGHDQTARLQLESGVTVDLECTWSAALGRDAEIEVDFFGTRANALLRNVGGSFHDFVATSSQGRSSLLVEPPDDCAPRALASWAWRLGEGAGFDCEAWELVQLARVIDAIYGRAEESAEPPAQSLPRVFPAVPWGVEPAA